MQTCFQVCSIHWVGMQTAKVTDTDFPKLPLQFINFLSKECVSTEWTQNKRTFFFLRSCTFRLLHATNSHTVLQGINGRRENVQCVGTGQYHGSHSKLHNVCMKKVIQQMVDNLHMVASCSYRCELMCLLCVKDSKRQSLCEQFTFLFEKGKTVLAVFQDELFCVSINISEGTRLAWKQVSICVCCLK